MALKARYTVVDGEVIAEKRSGVRHQLVPDPLGSTIALLDNTQTQTDTFTYWPYGEEQSRTGTTLTPLRFVGTLGYYRDSSTRSYVRARYLSTQQGRWLTQDPIGFDGGDVNLYRYTANQPIDIIDPSGFQMINEAGDLCGGPPNPNEGWGYGYYCGPDRNPFHDKYPKGPPAKQPKPPVSPYDILDSCCVNHDWAYFKNNCKLRGIEQRKVCKDADLALCNCVKKVDCSKVKKKDKLSCQIVQTFIIGFFCNVLIKPPKSRL